MINDVHSPDKVRVNAVLSSMDNFYEIYDIDEKCGLYKENKVKKLKQKAQTKVLDIT